MTATTKVFLDPVFLVFWTDMFLLTVIWPSDVVVLEPEKGSGSKVWNYVIDDVRLCCDIRRGLRLLTILSRS